MLAEAVRQCCARGVGHLIYEWFDYGKKTGDSLTKFKENNGFVRMNIPRYYVPLTAKGHLALRTGLHRSPKERIPSGSRRRFATCEQDGTSGERPVSAMSRRIPREDGLSRFGCDRPSSGKTTSGPRGRGFEHPMVCASYRVEVDQIGAPDWADALGQFADANLYQTWAYGAVRWGERNLSHLVLKRDEKIVAIAQTLILRPLPLRVGVGHLRWGPLCHREGHELEPDIVERMADALQDEYARKRGLFLRVLPNGWVPSARAQVFRAAFSKYREQRFRAGESYRTVVLDLTPSLDVIRKRLDQKWRNQLNRAEKNGLTIKQGEAATSFPVFWKVYEEMLARKSFAAPSDVRQFERVQAELVAGQWMKVFICEDGGVPVGGLVGTAMGKSGIYLLGATNEQGMKVKGAYLLQWRMIQWLKEIGVVSYDLGGINPRMNPGVYHFKAGLGGQDVLYLNPFTSSGSAASTGFASLVDLAHGSARQSFSRLIGQK